ncbi:MAG: hypothetical protein D6782_08900 [Alphaproteobacteria bacterium]|nr:MAG: hypothetical protein D6782_08900 [Alphaproteobacteria bacterium]
MAAAFGDALGRTPAFTQVAFTDVYDRTYRADLSGRLRSAASGIDLLARLRHDRMRLFAEARLGRDMAFSASALRRHDVTPVVAQAMSPLLEDAARTIRYPRMAVTASWRGLALDVSHGYGVIARDWADVHDGLGPAAYPEALFGGTDSTALAVGMPLGETTRLRFAAAFEAPAADDPAVLAVAGEAGSRRLGAVTLAQEGGHGGWQALLGGIVEKGMVLGGRTNGALKLADGAATAFIAWSGDYALERLWQGKHPWRLAAGMVAAVTDPTAATDSLLRHPGTLMASPFHAEIATWDMLAAGDRLHLGLSQPLRIEAGSIAAHVPVARDLTAPGGRFRFAAQRLSLAPSGREIDLELGYRRGLASGGALAADLLLRRDAGHVASENDMALLVRFEKAF